jgi:hypothetical protein
MQVQVRSTAMVFSLGDTFASCCGRTRAGICARCSGLGEFCAVPGVQEGDGMRPAPKVRAAVGQRESIILQGKETARERTEQ